MSFAISCKRAARIAAAPLAIVLGAPGAMAFEFGQIRAMQTGPVGDSPQFADIEKYEAEGGFTLQRTFGHYKLNGDTDTQVDATGITSHLVAGGGMAPTKNFALSAYVDVTAAADYDEEQTRGATATKYDGGNYRHQVGLFGMYRPGPLVFGGGIGALIVGTETKEFDVGATKITEDVGTAAMPVLSLFGGLATKSFDGTLGIKFFSKGMATVDSVDATGKKEEFDVLRRSPAEFHADAKLKFPTAYVAATINYVLTGQASEQVDEFSTRYETNSKGKLARVSGLGTIDANHLVIGIGGRFDPVKLFGLMGALEYTTAAAKSDEFSSPEQDNLGGLRFDLGGEVTIQKFRGFLNLNYTLDQQVTFTASNDDRGAANGDRTLKPALSKDDSVRMTQGGLGMAVGVGVRI